MTHKTDESGHEYFWRLGRQLAYSLTMSFGCALLSFVGLVTIGPRFYSGEGLEALGLRWWFGLPVILLVGAAGVVTFRWFDRATAWPQWLLIWVATLVSVTVVAVITAWAVEVLIWQ